MSYEELVQVEDRLLLKNELNNTLRIRFTAGRVVLFLLGGSLWLVLFLLMQGVVLLFKEALRGLASFFSVWISLGLAVYGAHKLWDVLGVGPRMFFRYGLHYWPVILSLVGFCLLLLR